MKDKAPGPDGFNSAFYIDNWDVGKDFIAGIREFFITKCVP